MKKWENLRGGEEDMAGGGVGSFSTRWPSSKRGTGRGLGSSISYKESHITLETATLSFEEHRAKGAEWRFRIRRATESVGLWKSWASTKRGERTETKEANARSDFGPREGVGRDKANKL